MEKRIKVSSRRGGGGDRVLYWIRFLGDGGGFVICMCAFFVV